MFIPPSSLISYPNTSKAQPIKPSPHSQKSSDLPPHIGRPISGDRLEIRFAGSSTPVANNPASQEAASDTEDLGWDFSGTEQPSADKPGSTEPNRSKLSDWDFGNLKILSSPRQEGNPVVSVPDTQEAELALLLKADSKTLDWPPQVLQTLRDVCLQAHYGKTLEHLYSSSKPIILYNQGKGIIQNYHEPAAKAPPFYGVCNDLAYSVGRFLQQKLGTEYIVKAAKGNCGNYFHQGEHLYLLIGKQNQVAAMKRQPLTGAYSFPPDCVVVDPSFNRVIPSKEREMLKDAGYRLQAIQDLQTLEPGVENSTRTFDEIDDTLFPLGYAKSLLPASDPIISEQGEDAILYWLISTSAGSAPVIQFAVQSKAEREEPSKLNTKELLQRLPMQSPLVQLYEKLSCDLKSQSSIV